LFYTSHPLSNGIIGRYTCMLPFFYIQINITLKYYKMFKVACTYWLVMKDILIIGASLDGLSAGVFCLVFYW